MAMLPDDIRAQMQPEEDAVFLIKPENWDALCIFCAAATQWRWFETQRLALIYSEITNLMGLYAVQNPRDCFERVQVMEMEVLQHGR